MFNAAADTAEELAPKPRASSGLNGVAFFKTDVDARADAARGSASGPDVELICFSRADAGLGVRLLVTQASAAVGPALKTSAWLRPLYRLAFAGARAASRTRAIENLVAGVMALAFARRDSAEDVCRLKARRCTAMGRIFIPAYCFAIS